DLATTSFYGMEQFREQLQLVNHIRGRVSGTHDGKALFAISKVREKVSMLDPASGEPKKVNQWIVRLEADLDMSKVFASMEQPAPAGARAAAALAGPTPAIAEDGPAPAADPEPSAAPPQDAGQIKAMREQADERLRGLCENIDGLEYEAVVVWLADTIGPGWGRGLDGLTAAIDLLDDADNDPEDFAARVSGTDCPF
ncbi:MAG: hypothetical protein L0H83_15045, partial [Salinisphaera sp.]|nr:hypothetical protein [Salinisphaera sp.]